MSKTKADPNYKVIAENRRARFDYAIENDLDVVSSSLDLKLNHAQWWFKHCRKLCPN